MAYRHPVGGDAAGLRRVFLALLGVCGYIGAERTHVQSVVSLPVTRVELEGKPSEAVRLHKSEKG
ncbi:MAG: hypothetical protein ACLUHE_16355 [Christensenellales bacterium]